MTAVMDEGKVLIVNLAKGKIGEDNANFLGSLIVSDIVGRAMQRADRPEASRRDFHLFIDEFQSLTSDRFATIVSEARKYRLSRAISHQNFDQISPDVLAAILKNTGTLCHSAGRLHSGGQLLRLLRSSEHWEGGGYRRCTPRPFPAT